MLLLEAQPNTLRKERRIRTLENWSIHDWGDGEYSVAGWVTTGNEPGDGQVARTTRTSPIQFREGDRKVITESGSEYTLGTPAERQDPDQILQLFNER